MSTLTPPSSLSSPRRRGFTLTELLVVMGVITVLATLTVIGIRGVARNARMASATNGVMVALDTARAVAMKENAIVLVVFRPRLETPKKMVVETVLARWTGESYVVGTDRIVIDRFVPIQGIPPRALPEGIKVAGPAYRQSGPLGPSSDDVWLTQAHLPAIDQDTPLIGERPGALIGVMYASDGSTITRNSRSDSNSFWVDFFVDPDPAADPTILRFGNPVPLTIAAATFFKQWWETDETLVTVVPFLAVYDDEKARELRVNDDWTNQDAYEGDLTGPEGYINLRADRIHFNRYTGVAMK